MGHESGYGLGSASCPEHSIKGRQHHAPYAFPLQVGSRRAALVSCFRQANVLFTSRAVERGGFEARSRGAVRQQMRGNWDVESKG